MKRTLRPFVVETKQGKKPRSWIAELDSQVMSPSRQKAELTAAEVFSDIRSKPAEKAAPSNAPRVLPDLSRDVAPPEPEAAETSAVEAAEEPLVEPPAAPRPRRPRQPRARSPEPAAAEPHIRAVPAAAEAPEAELEPDLEPEAAEAMDDASATGMAAPARTDLRSRRVGRRQLARAELPLGQRWKRRLHPAAW
ncbi:hypothetical protein GCM10010994_03480 [Chelatococcus reniformis]|uniref:Uncharacterized protein n=1 Tax=Chelatococcus reniformis TaxID=1494448 RepID=A0A916TY62_9HYPH|nr:hypothetical protein GCM10010994_03480 [Chelatococcus reniformis]